MVVHSRPPLNPVGRDGDRRRRRNLCLYGHRREQKQKQHAEREDAAIPVHGQIGVLLLFKTLGPLFSQRSKTYPKINGRTIVASLLMLKRGVSGPSLPQVIFSFGGAPE